MALAERADLVARLSLKDDFSGKLRGATGALGKFQGSIGRVGKGVGQLGTGLARASLLVGGAVVTGLGAAAKAAIDFEDAFAGVRKTVDETELTAVGLSFEDLARQFRKMATEIPIAATELAAIGETAGALGIRAQDIDEFTKTVALLGVTTDLSSDQAAEALGKVGTILGLTGKEFEDFADILVNLGNKGASTEAEIIEITKRFGAAGRQAGLSTQQILAFASAIASAGVEPEAAGSSLSRLFGNLITETALASKKAKAFAAVAGVSFKEFAQIVKKDTTGAMLLFLDSLKDLGKFEQQKVLKQIGITNVRDRNAILLLASTYDKNLIPALENAQTATGALGKESQKRFDTIASKLKLFKQNLIEAGITIGEGLTPALGRATDKLIAFLRDPNNASQLKALGEDIGKAIDGIDWNQVLNGAKSFVGVMKGALQIALEILKALDKLPTELKAAGLGFLALNKLSGGLVGAGIGNIIGGLAGAGATGLASRAPGVGRFFAQPVFVTNWPAGAFTGGGAGGKGGGIGGAIGGAVATGVVIQGAADAGVIVQGFDRVLKSNNVNDITNALRDVKSGVLLFPPAVQGIMDVFLRQLPSAVTNPVTAASEKITTRVESMRGDMVAAMQRAGDKSTLAAERTRGAIFSASGLERNAIVGAIARNRPIVNVRVSVRTSSVTKNYTTGTQTNRQRGETEYDI